MKPLKSPRSTSNSPVVLSRSDNKTTSDKEEYQVKKKESDASGCIQ